MHIQDVFARHTTTFSFEFFPPKTPESAETLFENIRELEQLRPSFVSVTYGAGGGTREVTQDLVMRLKRETSLDPVPHQTSVCHNEQEIRDLLMAYADVGVSNLLALGGDPPRNMPDYDRKNDAFQYAADLVRFIRQFNESGTHHDPRGFGIGVAGFPEGHPATPNRLDEMDFLKAKIDAGADYICTQLFFDNRDFYDYRERCELAGIRVPIIAGVMPVLSWTNFKKIPSLALGARYPAKLLKRLDRFEGDDRAMRAIGLDWATQQCHDLLDHDVRGIHFYTMNRATATVEIFRRLGASNTRELAEFSI